jgi:hypothetical protein
MLPLAIVLFILCALFKMTTKLLLVLARTEILNPSPTRPMIIFYRLTVLEAFRLSSLAPDERRIRQHGKKN